MERRKQILSIQKILELYAPDDAKKRQSLLRRIGGAVYYNRLTLVEGKRILKVRPSRMKRSYGEALDVVELGTAHIKYTDFIFWWTEIEDEQDPTWWPGHSPTVDPADAELGRRERERRVSMATLSQALREESDDWWKSYENDCIALVKQHHSIIRAAQIVSDRYPDRNINVNTLRLRVGKILNPN